MLRILGCLLVVAFLLVPSTATSAEVAPAPRKIEAKLPISGLTPAKPMFEACLYKYPVSTTNSLCQSFVNQGLGQYYSYVWIDAVRAFETALQHDPECAYAWLMLSRSLEKWGKGNAAFPTLPYTALLGSAVTNKLPKNAVESTLETARLLMPKANPREQLLIQSRLQEKGTAPATGPDDRRKKAAQTLDELLMLYDDDEEGWFWRAQLATDNGQNAVAVFYKALTRVNPLHPGANHEFVHFFDNIRRPALGWPYAENFIKSSPGIPHAHHMQAHLATRIGKWAESVDWSAKAVQLQLAYHKLQGVTPGEDHQLNHHMEVLSRSLVHDGRFAESKANRALAESFKYNFRADWLRMAIAQHDWPEAQKLIDQFRKSDKATGAYFSALVSLEKGDTKQVGNDVDTLRQLRQTNKTDKKLERRIQEVQGWHQCQTGQGVAGLMQLKKLVDATKNDFSHHNWGNGAVYMESWGMAALEAGVATDAEEAFQEALAHDNGSVRGALGLWALSNRLGRAEEASRYLKLAHRLWAKADPKDFATLQEAMTKRAGNIQKPMTATAGQ